MKVPALVTRSTALTEPVALIMAIDSVPAFGEIAATRMANAAQAKTSVASMSVSLAIAPDQLLSRAIHHGLEVTQPMEHAETRISTLAVWFMACVATRITSAALWNRIVELAGEFVSYFIVEILLTEVTASHDGENAAPPAWTLFRP